MVVDSSTKPRLQVEIYSDVVCPWCYIGKRRWEKALDQFEDRDRIDVVWRPHQLDPRASAEPAPVAEGYARKFGGPEQARQIIDQMTQTAATEGLEFRFDIAQRANTFDAHRLLWLAEREGDQHAVKEGLLRAYFCEGGNVADHETLTSVATAAGLDETRVRSFLGSSEGVDETRQELAHGAEAGVTAVPTFVFNGQWSVPGAQDPETFVRVLRRLVSKVDGEAAATATSAAGASA